MSNNSLSENKTATMHEILRNMPYGLYIVGVGMENTETNALVASWVTQCSFEPPMLAVAIRKDSVTSKLICEMGIFTVNLIGPDQEGLARKTVRPAHQAGDKLGKISHTVEKTGAPILRDAMAFLECKVRGVIETGDHYLAIGEVVNAGGEVSGELMTSADIGWRYGG